MHDSISWHERNEMSDSDYKSQIQSGTPVWVNFSDNWYVYCEGAPLPLGTVLSVLKKSDGTKSQQVTQTSESRTHSLHTNNIK